jgi:hypothetical protein
MNIEGLKLETHVSANTTIDKVKHVSNVTINWEGISLDQLQALAQRSIVIRKQNDDRNAGVIPGAAYTIRAADYVIGTRRARTPESLESLLGKLSAEERAQLLAKYLSN